MNRNLSFIILVGILSLLLFGCITQNDNGITFNPGSWLNLSSEKATQNISSPDTQNAVTFNEWKAPDGSITLQVPEGWQAAEKQIDTCTVNWNVIDPVGMRSAYMSNEIIVLKSENARQLYSSYGIAGVDAAPVSNYLGAEQAVQQIIAPLTGSSAVQVTYKDAVLSQQFSDAVCLGFAACDAQAFEAAYMRNGVLMRGKYLVQTYDFGEGTTWWINLWGYTSPAADWDKLSPTLEKVFTSVKYTDSWAAKCKKNTNAAASTIDEVIKNRQATSDQASEAWDKYIRGE